MLAVSYTAQTIHWFVKGWIRGLCEIRCCNGSRKVLHKCSQFFFIQSFFFLPFFLALSLCETQWESDLLAGCLILYRKSDCGGQSQAYVSVIACVSARPCLEVCMYTSKLMSGQRTGSLLITADSFIWGRSGRFGRMSETCSSWGRWESDDAFPPHPLSRSHPHTHTHLTHTHK